MITKKTTNGNGAAKTNGNGAHQEFDNTNRIALFKNKKEGANQPTFKGSMTTADGTEYWVSLWTKTSKAGEKFLSGAIQPKEDAPPAKTAEGFAKGQDEIPF